MKARAGNRNGLRLGVGTALCLLMCAPLVFAHPCVEGGIKTGFTGVPGFAYCHMEFVADPTVNELRIYVSEAEDETLPDGKKREWVINLTVRKGKAAGKSVNLLPLRDPGPGKEWFPVAPVEKKGGYVFYRTELTGRVMLDKDPKKRVAVTFAAGRDARGRHCYKAGLNLARAKTLRLEEITFSAIDAAGKKPAWTKICFQAAFGQGLVKIGRMKKVAQTDLALKGFADAIAQIRNGDKYRKPESPPISRR